MHPSSTRPFWQTFLIFVLPLMAANILQALSGTINNIFLGQLIGVQALAAASVFFPIVFVFISFLIGLSAGGSVVIGQAYGARDYARVKAVTGTVICVSVVGGAVIGLICALATRPILAALGTPADIFEQAVVFARINFLAMPLMFLFFIASSVLRGVGDSMTPLYALIVSTVVSAALTPALILGWAGLPQLGIAAPAVASIIAFAISVVVLGFYLRWRGHVMAPDRALIANLRPDPKILLLVIRLGVPTGIQVITGAAAGLVIMGMVNSFGSSATAAYGAVNQIMSYVQFPAISIAIASSIFGAQVIGAGRAHELGRVTRTGLMMNLFLTGGLVVTAYLASETVIGFFVNDPAIVALAERLLYIVLWSTVLFGASTVLAGVMRASGTVIMPMVISIFCIVAIELPLAIWLSRSMGLEGIWWGLAASFCAVMVLQAAYYWFVWRKKRVVALS